MKQILTVESVVWFGGKDRIEVKFQGKDGKDYWKSYRESQWRILKNNVEKNYGMNYSLDEDEWDGAEAYAAKMQRELPGMEIEAEIEMVKMSSGKRLTNINLCSKGIRNERQCVEDYLDDEDVTDEDLEKAIARMDMDEEEESEIDMLRRQVKELGKKVEMLSGKKETSKKVRHNTVEDEEYEGGYINIEQDWQ